MPQNLADLGHWNAALKHARGQRMAKQMSTAMRRVQLDALQSAMNHASHRLGYQAFVGCLAAKKNPASGRAAAPDL
jgi:hypothetical protein